MSAAIKFNRAGAYNAFIAGRLHAQRERWMQVARNEKRSGTSQILIKQCVGYARERNARLVKLLRKTP